MTDQPKDFAVKITVKNNRIIQAMKRANIPTFSQLARLSSIEPSRLGEIIAFKYSPLARGDWSSHAYNISSALHCEPEDLWPSHIKHLKSEKGYADLTLNADELKNLSAPANIQIDKLEVQKLISKLAPREQKAINDIFFDEKTLEETGKGFGVNGGDVGPTMARIVLAQSLRKLRHPSRLGGKIIEDFIEE